MDTLAKGGIELDRHHVFQYCSPSRSAFHTGRNPVHVNVLNSLLDQHNPADPVSGYMGIPRNMTALPAKLKTAGYATHMVGKWHCGMATPDHTPRGRGYDTALHYFCGANDYWTAIGVELNCTSNFTDLFNTSAPAYGANNSWACSQSNQPPASCTYEDELFTESMVSTIHAHDPSVPLFAYVAFHNVHAPLEVPQAQLQKFAWIVNENRRSYMAMTNLMDTNLGRIVQALKDHGLWDNTLLVAAADNGGPIMAGANNYPLRGSKMSNWQGGTRGNAFVAGGLVPAAMRGQRLEGFIAVEDWYTTFCALAGVDPTDERGAKAGLPPVDGINMWPYLSGAVSSSPRTELWTGNTNTGSNRDGTTVVQGLTNTTSGYELLVGQLPYACWTGPLYPNNTVTTVCNVTLDCGFPDAPSPEGKKGCLFNILTDPTQHNDVAEVYPDIVQTMYSRLQEVNATAFSPDRGQSDPAACTTFQQKWGGFYGPFLP